MNDKLNQIYELKGRLSVTSITYKEALDHLVNVAKVQSTDASNRIEGIYTSNTRLNQLVHQKKRAHVIAVRRKLQVIGTSWL